MFDGGTVSVVGREAASRFWAIGAPILPVPSTAMAGRAGMG
jgi:hypothetical protein